jgi:hypothetical protein
MSNVDFRGLLARTVQIAAGIGALYLCAMKLLGPRYAISKATFAMFTVTPALMWMRQLLGFGELIAGLSILFGRKVHNTIDVD